MPKSMEEQNLMDSEMELHTSSKLINFDRENIPNRATLVLRELFSCGRRGQSRFRRVRSKGAIILLIINCFITPNFFGSFYVIMQSFFKDYLHITETGVILCLVTILIRSIPQMGYPLAGWLADVHLGRSKVIIYSLWLIFIGHVLMLSTFLFVYSYDPDHKTGAYYVVIPVAFVLINSGLAGYQANIIPFGLDQMPDASTEELGAFINWYYATRNVLFFVVPMIPHFLDPIPWLLPTIVTMSCQAFFLLIAVIMTYGFRRYFIIEPHGTNPFSMVYKVLKFAAKNKIPLSRSAFTYWEDEIPGRIDLGKRKYGGPFSNEQVEDVKTFMRMTCILVSISVFMINHYTFLIISQFSAKFVGNQLGTVHSIGSLLLTVLDPVFIFLMIAFYEAIIHPFFKVLIPSMFRRMGLGLIVSIIELMVVVAIDIYGKSTLNETNTAITDSECLLINNTEIYDYDISVYLLSLPIFLTALAEILVIISILEFITAQSPYRMRGMLIGTSYCIRGAFAFITALLILFFTLGYKDHPLPAALSISCSTPLILAVISIALIGLVVFIVVARRYKCRERDEHVNTRIFIEKYYYGT